MNDYPDSSPRPILICGLGLLGQHCAVLLKEIGVPVFGLDQEEQKSWEIEGMPELLDRHTVGDCRRHSALNRAGIALCRAVLFTTDEEQVNVSGAVAARSLNPGIRLVIRSSQSNLNDLLHQRLGNLMALDIAELPATTFSLAAIGGETVGLLKIDGEFLRVVEKRIPATHPWLQNRELGELNTRRRRVLQVTKSGIRQSLDFHSWNPTELLRPDDMIACIEFYQPDKAAGPTTGGEKPLRTAPHWDSILSRVRRFWMEGTQTRKVATLAAGALVLIHATGVVLYKLQYPETSLLDAFNVATVLIFDGYSNMFAQLKLPFHITLWMLLFSLMMTMSGAVVMGMVYAFLTARVLSARLEFRRRPSRIPKSKHVVVIGMERLGRRVATLLSDLKHPVVGVSAKEFDSALLPGIPVITGDPLESLKKANCSTAASVMALTNDDVTNLEIALMSAQLNEDCRFVIRTDDAEFGRNVTALAPHTQALSIYALSAEAFAAGALGERVLNLLRIGHQTVLTTEFKVETGDNLQGRLLVEVTCGYGLSAILYQRRPSEEVEFFPRGDVRLEPGSRLVVLATIGGLQNAEHGLMAPREHLIRVVSVKSDEAAFEGGLIISRVSGCHLGTASNLFSGLPATLSYALFRHQAQWLVRELRIVGVEAEALPVSAERVGTAHLDCE